MYIGIDLGTTNIKVALYSGSMELLDRQSRPVSYFRENAFVEFDILRYQDTLLALLRSVIERNCVHNIAQIAFTGQAESLVVLDSDGAPLMNAIS